MIKIAIIGGECTGKTTLCEHLAQHFKAPYLKEYARDYLAIQKKYNLSDLNTIAKHQYQLEALLIQQHQHHDYIFLDTDFSVLKVWSEYVFNTCDPFILNHIAAQRMDAYVVCGDDVAWQQDGLREYPDPNERKKISLYYKDFVVNQRLPFCLVSGNPDERLKQVIHFLRQIKS